MEGLPRDEECICLPDPGEITEPRGEYDAGLQIEADLRQQQKQQRQIEQQQTMPMAAMPMATLPQRPAVVCEQDAAQYVEPTAQPVTARPMLDRTPLIPPMDMQSTAEVPKGAKTSEYYKTFDIPDRFDNPGKCFIPGNPVFSCGLDVPSEQTLLPMPDEWFQGYSQRSVHPMYRTTSTDYGSRTPTVHTMPTKFYPMSQEFSGHLGKCGMFRNHSLNCELDKSNVPDH